MSKRILLCTVLLVTLLCNPIGGSPTPVPERSPHENEKCGCLIIDLQGKAYVRPENSMKSVSLLPNMAVYAGDFVRVAESSRVRLVCGEVFEELTSGVHSVPCTADKQLMRIGDRLVDSSMTRDIDTSFPRLLSPRKTKLLSPHPKLVWTIVPNATGYVVSVRGPNVNWSVTVTGNETVYPDDAPALVPGQQYKVTIFAGRRKSDDEGLLELDFSVLETQKAEEVKSRESAIRNLKLEDTTKRLLIAYLYAGYDLNAEAIMQLNEASNDQELVRLLAELYLRIMLLDKAEAQFLHAVELADGNEPGRAIAYDRLGQIAKALGKPEQAKQRYESAIRSFVDLENWTRMCEIGRRLEELQKR